MRVAHCGVQLGVSRSRLLMPTEEESLRGVVSVMAHEHWCQKVECRKKVYTKVEYFQIGEGPMTRVKRNIGSFVARLKVAKESDWVWGYNKETFGKIKVTVR